MNEVQISSANADLNVASAAADPVLFQFLAAAQVLGARLEAALIEVGLSVAKFDVVHQLHEAGNSLPLRVLAVGKRCVPSNMTQLIDRLEAEGLVRRVDDPSDRRVVRAELTALGQERATAGAHAVMRVQTSFAASLGKTDRAALIRLFSALQQD
jgi:DNA-binding MarR family transcriptional regulator